VLGFVSFSKPTTQKFACRERSKKSRAREKKRNSKTSPTRTKLASPENPFQRLNETEFEPVKEENSKTFSRLQVQKRFDCVQKKALETSKQQQQKCTRIFSVFFFVFAKKRMKRKERRSKNSLREREMEVTLSHQLIRFYYDFSLDYYDLQAQTQAHTTEWFKKTSSHLDKNIEHSTMRSLFLTIYCLFRC
jgi:hypothetical protein